MPQLPSPPPSPLPPEGDKELACAQSLADAGAPEEACRHLQSVLEAHPCWARGWNRLGLLRVRQGDLDGAAEAFRRACQLDPAAASAYNNLGNLALARRDPAGAEQLYRAALAADPDLSAAHANLARLVARRGRLREALAHRRQAALAPAANGPSDPPPALLRWGVYLALAGVALAWWAWREPAKPARAAEPPPAALGLPATPGEALGPPPAEAARPSEEGGAWILEAGAWRWPLGPEELAAAHRAQAVQELARRVAQRLDRRLSRPPQEPRVIVQEDGTVWVVPGQPGRRVDVAALARLLEQALAQPAEAGVIPVPVVTVPPRVGPEQLQALQVPALLSRFTTRLLPGDPPERGANIVLAARALDGLVLPPGGRFSFNEEVGPRVTERGYLQAPVLVRGQVALDVGGGVCQVSSTLYNAALLAGLLPRFRAPHSIPVPYVTPGRDAAVAYGLIDLRLENPLPYPVALSARVAGDRLSVAVVGPAQAEIPSYQLRTVVEWHLPAGVEEVPDASLAPGQRVSDSPPRSGYGASVWREFTLYGPLSARRRVNLSVYDPRPARVRVGPGPAPAWEDGGQEWDGAR